MRVQFDANHNVSNSYKKYYFPSYEKLFTQKWNARLSFYNNVEKSNMAQITPHLIVLH